MFLLVWPGDNGKQACTTARSIAWHAYHSARFNLGSSGSWNQRVNLFLPSILFLKMLDYQKKSAACCKGPSFGNRIRLHSWLSLTNTFTYPCYDPINAFWELGR